MPNRLLREGILTSDRVDQLDAAAEVFYRRLMSVVDDYGRFDARPSMLRVSCFPLRVDKVREGEVKGWLNACAAAGLVALYEVGGKPYLELRDFRQAVRAKASRYPCSAGATHMSSTCYANATHMHVSAPVDEVGVVVGVEDGGGVERARAQARARPTRTLAEPTSEHTDLAAEEKVDCQAEFRKYRDWLNAQGKKHRDEHAGFRNWLRRAGEFARQKAGRNTVHDKRAATAAAIYGNPPEPPNVEPTDITGEARRIA